MKAIEVSNLSKYFGNRKRGKKGMHPGNRPIRNNNSTIKAVDDISFSVDKGEIFGFLGPNGAGKTTTIRIMTGVLEPTMGSIKILGLDAWKNQIAIKQITGNVPEMANVYGDLSGIQNLLFIGELYGVPKAERKLRAENLLKKFELFGKHKIKAKKYSKGMNQRLLLCMSLMNDPEILFLDEPTSGLDVQSSRIIKQLIKEYNEMGKAIFLTTHDMDVANEICHRIAIINHGKINSLDTPQNLKRITQKYQAIDCYIVNGVNKQEIESLSTVKEVLDVNHGCHIIVTDISKAIYELVDYFKTHNVEIKELNTHQPKLEDAFLKIIERGDKNAK